MSNAIGTIKNSGSRDVDMDVTTYYGGADVGTCVQLTAVQEDGSVGYVQLSSKDMKELVALLINESIMNVSGEPR